MTVSSIRQFQPLHLRQIQLQQRGVLYPTVDYNHFCSFLVGRTAEPGSDESTESDAII